MIDFNKIPSKLNTDFILNRITDEDIFRYYFGDFEIRTKTYNSVFRKDKTPSTGFYISKRNKIIYNDLATGEKYDCFDFVKTLYNITHKEALEKIASDFGLINGNPTAKSLSIINSPKIDKENSKAKLIQFIPDKWKDHHINYWNKFEITLEELNNNKVFPVKKLFIDKVEISVSELCFAYVIEHYENDELKTYIKIYQPYSDKENGFKWISNVPIHIPFGYTDLTDKKSELLIIGKAQKDRMILKKYFNNVISTQNESVQAFRPDLLPKLSNFKCCVFFWDADKTGLDNLKTMKDNGYEIAHTPLNLINLGIKDVSDFVEVYGLKNFEKYLHKLKLL